MGKEYISEGILHLVGAGDVTKGLEHLLGPLGLHESWVLQLLLPELVEFSHQPCICLRKRRPWDTKQHKGRQVP